MWSFVIFVGLLPWCGCHERSARQQQGAGWDIRLAVPGDPGNDYPTLGNIPRTSFSCSGKAPGYYADLETNCQAFRVCTSGSTYGFQSFLCPNGTLFNQAVVVCDWWMNVNCQTSGEFINNNNEKFGNLRLGPQLMKDIKKMITHPMRNPYDKTIMKSNLIVMQDYKPPANQMFGALLAGNVRVQNNVFVPSKQFQQLHYSNSVFAASTPSPSYVPPPTSNLISPHQDAEVFQRQRQNGQYQQSGRHQQQQTSQLSNGHGVQFTQSESSGYSYNNVNLRPTQTYSNQAQYRQQQDFGNTQTSDQRGQYRQSGQYTDGRNQAQLQYSQINTGQINHEAKENLVSNETPATIVTKTLTYNRIVDPEPGKPKSRITIKTWIVKPTKAAKLIAEPTAYNYARPTNPPSERQVAAATAYNYNPPTTTQPARLVSQPEGPYSYNNPTTAAKLVESSYVYNNPTTAAKLVEPPYVYNNPTTAAKLVQPPYVYNNPTTAAKLVQPPYVYNNPTTAAKLVQPSYVYNNKLVEPPYSYNRPTAAAKLVATPPRQPSRQYLTPTSAPPAAKLVVTPPRQPSRQYLTPTSPPPPAKLIASPSRQQSRQHLTPTSAFPAKLITAPPRQPSRQYLTPTSAAPAAKLIATPRQQPPRQYLSPTSPPPPAKLVATPPSQPSQQYLSPTSPPPTLARIYLNPTTAPPTLPSQLYLAPTTYKPAAKLYIPPSQAAKLIVSRQYLTPSAIQQPAYYQSAKIQASPTSPTYATANENQSYTVTKHSHIKSNHNNLTFSDILTKEKLDITVNDIVSDTSSILKTASPVQENDQYHQEKDYSDESYIQSDNNNESDEILTPQSPTVVPTSARIVQGPATDLEPPLEGYDFNQNIVNTNKLATLPFYKEPATNTIERTVSLKISIPEKVASYLFKSHNESDYDKLEILNTGSSNYLVLSNNLASKNTDANFIPLGRLIADKNTNISDSQALVFNFLADSLNAAKEYSNIAKLNIIAPTPSQFQAVNNQQLARITNQISQLTASQYSGNQNNFNHGNIVSPATLYQSAKYTNGYPQNQQQINSAPARLTSQQGYEYQNPNNGFSGNLQVNSDQIYSGQLYKLPVPEVTDHVYNAGTSNLVQGQQQYPTHELHSNEVNQQSSAEVEIVQSHTLPIAPPAPAKIQQFTPNEGETFHSQENSRDFSSFFNSGNGISAQLQDKIVGTIPHPVEDNKYVTYKKDQSYYFTTKLNNNIIENTQSHSNNIQSNGQSAKIIQGNQNVDFQFVPSVSYQLEDEKEQQKILNDFQINEYGTPKQVTQVHDTHRHDLISDVDYAVEHPQSAKQIDGQVNEVNTLYTGPSSYSAPQASVGSLEANDVQNSNARLEQLEENGYGRVTPANQFSY